MNRINQLTVHKIFYGLLVLFMAAGLKYSYSQAGSDDLVWMLGPTATLVEWIAGIPFVRETGVGYVSPSAQVAIVPACAGINFLVAAFCMTALSWIYALRRKSVLPISLPAALAAAYITTLCANALRISLSIYLYHADIYTALITTERVHRAAGIGIYFLCLCLLYAGVRRLTGLRVFSGSQGFNDDGQQVKNSLSACLPPLLWYLAIALLLPAIHLAYRKNPALFGEHAGFVLAVSFSLFVMMFVGVICYKSVKSKMKTG